MKKMTGIAMALITAGIAQVSLANSPMESERGGMHCKHGSMEDKMSKMDADKDGMITKKEFMKAHEAMFDRMKGKNGMISVKDMAEKHEDMMSGGKMGGHGMMGNDPHHQGSKEADKK